LNYGDGSQSREALVVISVCQHKSAAKDGKDRNGNQRFRCKLCSVRFVEQTPKPLGDLRISLDQASTILGMLLEGMSVRAASRLTGVCKHTICDLIVLVGENSQRFLPQAVNGVEATDVQCDEL
jgi:transposase-like protein